MALTARSLLLYGYVIDTTNSSIDFKASIGGPTLLATLTANYYSLTDLMNEIVRAMNAADSSNTYTVTAVRTTSGGTQNRVTIATSGSFLSLLFGSGPRAASSTATLLGYTATDKTGSTSYTGTSTSGTALTSTLTGYNFLDTNQMRKVFGSLNISATGQKEAIVYQIQQFLQVQFKYEPVAKVNLEWTPFMTWAIQQRPWEFTPEITSPNTFYNVTLEKTAGDGKGLGFTIKEMLPDFPFLHDIGLLTLRLKV